MPFWQDFGPKNLQESIKVVDQKVYALKEPNLDFIAKTFAESEFEKYRIVQDKLFKSDFDKFLKETKEVESDEARESLLPFLYSYFPHGSGQPLQG